MRAAALLATLLLAPSLWSADDWLTGTLLDSTELTRISAEGNNSLYAQITNQQGAQYEEQHDYYILHGDLIYVVRQNLRPKSITKLYTSKPKPAMLTINDQIQFRVKGSKVEVLDERSKKHKMELVRKTRIRN